MSPLRVRDHHQACSKSLYYPCASISPGHSAYSPPMAFWNTETTGPLKPQKSISSLHISCTATRPCASYPSGCVCLRSIRYMNDKRRNSHKSVCFQIRQAYAMMPSEPSSSRVSYRRFKLLLQQPPLQALFSHATMHTSNFDELSSPLYRDYVVNIRTREHNIRAIKRLRYYHSTKVMRSCFYRWQDTVRIRKQTRIRTLEMCGKLAHVKRQWAFIALQRHAMVSIAAIEIQRMYRGYRDRCRADAQWRLVQAAIAVQGAFRMRSHFVRFIRDTKKRNLRAIRIQVIVFLWSI